MKPCHSGNAEAPVEFSFALQPIIDADNRTIFSYEAFVRGYRGEPACTVVDHIDHIGKALFNTLVCDRSIGLAAQLGLKRHLSVNLFAYADTCAQHPVDTVLEAAGRHVFPAQRIVIELTGVESAQNYPDLGATLKTCRQSGLRAAIDFVSADQRYLSMLADHPPAFIKLDRRVCAGIEHNKARYSIVDTLVRFSEHADISLIAEGVETREEFETLRDQGIALFQGYYFARPEFELLPAVPLIRMMRSSATRQCAGDGISPWARHIGQDAAACRER